MDAETERLIARARQRREVLNQKIGKTPEATPRKRRTPLGEDLTDNVVEEPEQQDIDDSPKRQRMRENEQTVKADTPAIPSVQSRLRNLASQHAHFSETAADDQETSTPVPAPRKSLSSPPLKRAELENARPGSMRKKRFADLVDNINHWEDDLSHPSIVKEEEKKPRWQPPKAKIPISVAPIGSPKKTRAPPPPASTADNSRYNKTPSKVTPSSPSMGSSSRLGQGTPLRSGSKVGFNSTPRPFQPYSESPRKVAPVKSPAASRSNLGGIRNDQGGLRSQETPKTGPLPPPKPLSAALAGWEQKTSEVRKTGSAAATPRSGTASSTPVSRTVKNTCTSARRDDAPARDEGEVVRMRPKVRQSIDDEPTAHPVLARMSAWEQMSSAQVISDIKKVKPGSATTPLKTPSCRKAIQQSPSMKAAERSTTTPSKTPSVMASKTRSATLSKTPSTTPSKTSSLTPSKSFKDSILERAAQVNPVTASEAGTGSPPSTPAGRTQRCASPVKASSAMRAVQQQLVQQTRSTSMAERIRQERMEELQSMQERWKNGVMNEEEPYDETPKPDSRKQAAKEQARSDFDNKLASIGFGTPSDPSNTAAPRKKGNEQNATNPAQKSSFSSNSCTLTPRAPPVPPPPPSSSSSATKVTGRPPQPTKSSLYKIVSQKKQESAAVQSPRAYTTAPSPGRTPGRKVKFEDSFESDDSEASLPKKPACELERTETRQPATVADDDESEESDATEDSPADEPTEDDDADFEVVLRHPGRAGNRPRKGPRPSEEDDDLSLSAFVPASVRRQSVLPSPQQQRGREEHRRDASTDSSDREPAAAHYGYEISRDQGRGQQSRGRREERSSSVSSASSGDSSRDGRRDAQPRSGYCPDDTEDSVDDRDAIGDLLEEAMDSDSQSEDSSDRRRTPVQAVVMRKRPSHRKATEDGELPFSINEYRASRNMQVLEVKQSIVRNSVHVVANVREERVEMPTHAPTPAPRRSVQERVRELQELIQQEQNVIMQTSNALSQCCSSASYFAGSAEQVECNRILLIACQKRQGYMMEVQRLRDTKVMDPSGPGPKGSLTISDIRLPLKKEFVTKIGTSHDTTTYFFIVLLRNGPQIISTQMLSTHDPMMRGSLDFPNLIKINGITGSFKLHLEIYSMSVSHEPVGKGKKKKTPKKAAKGGAHTVPTTGGSVATRTTSFSQVTSVPLNMKSLDKHSFHLERLSHLSPLHGTIYMNLKCLMEANVEERGFLTMFEDVSGFGSWHRRWCALTGNKLQFWKYPDDETRKDPMGYIDLKRCITEKVGLVSRDVCARPHTLELSIVRQPRKGERDTLTSRTYNTMTTVRYMLSADTKEERIVWCNKVNQALANIRTWHADAMRPIRQ